jgi:CyaY protein
MDDARYEQLAVDTLNRVVDLFEDVEPEDADVDPTGDVIRIALRNGAQIVVNTQRAAHQIWLAGGQRGWHFSYDEPGERWLDDRGQGEELFATLRALVRDAIGIELPG